MEIISLIFGPKARKYSQKTNRQYFFCEMHLDFFLLYLVLILSNFVCPKAWHLCDPDAERVFMSLRKAGVKLAVVSNFDTRLRPVLQALNCDDWFDAVAVSAEVSFLIF